MNAGLDDLLSRLASSPKQPPHQLEPMVWGRIRERSRWLGPAASAQGRFGAVALGLVVGVTMGGVVAASASPASRELSVFGDRPELAPSTLLDGSR